MSYCLNGFDNGLTDGHLSFFLNQRLRATLAHRIAMLILCNASVCYSDFYINLKFVLVENLCLTFSKLIMNPSLVFIKFEDHLNFLHDEKCKKLYPFSIQLFVYPQPTLPNQYFYLYPLKFLLVKDF